MPATTPVPMLSPSMLDPARRRGGSGSIRSVLKLHDPKRRRDAQETRARRDREILLVTAPCPPAQFTSSAGHEAKGCGDAGARTVQSLTQALKLAPMKNLCRHRPCRSAAS